MTTRYALARRVIPVKPCLYSTTAKIDISMSSVCEKPRSVTAYSHSAPSLVFPFFAIARGHLSIGGCTSAPRFSFHVIIIVGQVCC